MRLAFGYKFRSGKDTACDFLKSMYRGEILRIARDVYNCSEEIQKIINVPVKKDRKLLQFLGDGLREIYGEDIWIDKVCENIKYMEICGIDNFYIPDLRYKNEARKLKELGFILIRIDRTFSSKSSNENHSHRSEIELDDYEFDHIVSNNGTIEDLKFELLKLVKVHIYHLSECRTK